MGARTAAVLCLVLIVIPLVASTPAAESPSSQNRKLAQWRRGRGNYGNYSPYNDGDRQMARNQAAQINTQYAIRNAVESGANPRAVQGAAYTGSTNAWLAAQRSDLVWGPGGYWGRRRG